MVDVFWTDDDVIAREELAAIDRKAALRAEAQGPLVGSAVLLRELAGSMRQAADRLQAEAFALELLDTQLRISAGNRWWGAHAAGGTSDRGVA